MKKIKKSHFATICGVSRMAITKATKEGGALFPALTDDGEIEVMNPATFTYIKKRKLDEKALTSLGLSHVELSDDPFSDQPPQSPDDNVEDVILHEVEQNHDQETINIPEPKRSRHNPSINDEPVFTDVDIFLDMSLREITDIFGTDEQFKRWLDARRIIEDIKLKEVQANHKRGEYIPRSLVESHVFPFIDSAFMRLVEDLPETMSSQVYNKIQSGYELHDITQFVRESISKVLKGVKANATRQLNQG